MVSFGAFFSSFRFVGQVLKFHSAKNFTSPRVFFGLNHETFKLMICYIPKNRYLKNLYAIFYTWVTHSHDECETLRKLMLSTKTLQGVRAYTSWLKLQTNFNEKPQLGLSYCPNTCQQMHTALMNTCKHTYIRRKEELFLLAVTEHEMLNNTDGIFFYVLIYFF